MKYTEKYHLPQWVKEDRIMMEDFNQMCSDIEAGLERNTAEAVRANAQTAAEAANALAQAAAKAAADAQMAQSTADKAVADAAKAPSKADAAYSASNSPYVVGKYTGTGREQTVLVGFRPRFLIIAGGETRSHCIIVGHDMNVSSHLVFTSTGFTVRVPQDMSVPREPLLSEIQRTYNYIAFR